MKNMRTAPLFGASIITLAALLTACGGGGGGGGGSTTPPAPGGTPNPPNATPTPVTSSSPGSTPTPTTTATPAPTPTPGGNGQLIIGSAALANAGVVFTCGCTGDGGKITTDANGTYTITGSAQSVLNPSQTYTPNGHNLMVVGYTGSTQVWTMMFLGNTPANNLNLSNTPNNPSSNVSDNAATAAALYVYYAAGTQVSGGDHTFDWFNFNQIIAFAQHLRTSPDAAEQTLLSDVKAAQAANQSLIPGFTPQWNLVASDGVNAKITADVKAIAQAGTAGDSTLPTACSAPNACPNSPTP